MKNLHKIVKSTHCQQVVKMVEIVSVYVAGEHGITAIITVAVVLVAISYITES